MKIRINDNNNDIREFIMKVNWYGVDTNIDKVIIMMVNYHGVDANNDIVIIAMFKDNGHWYKSYDQWW